jgi:Zn-dependent membrane protease YugP
MFPLFFDPTFVLLIPAVILAFWAQMKVKTAYSEYSRVLSRKGISGAQAARALLDQFGMYNVPIQRVAGNLTDHYDPRDRTLHLSEGVFNSTSIAAIGVAAHEVGHAVQHQKNYAPLKFRNAVVPVVGVGSSLAFPLFFLGLLFRGPLLMDIGILFVGVIIFHLVTLPVEFDASTRAVKLLGDTGILGSDEITGAKAVLNAAALTYVAAAVMAFAQLARLLFLRGMFGHRD